jgi:hypothetical protein
MAKTPVGEIHLFPLRSSSWRPSRPSSLAASSTSRSPTPPLHTCASADAEPRSTLHSRRPTGGSPSTGVSVSLNPSVRNWSPTLPITLLDRAQSGSAGRGRSAWSGSQRPEIQIGAPRTPISARHAPPPARVPHDRTDTTSTALVSRVRQVLRGVVSLDCLVVALRTAAGARSDPRFWSARRRRADRGRPDIALPIVGLNDLTANVAFKAGSAPAQDRSITRSRFAIAKRERRGHPHGQRLLVLPSVSRAY